MAGSRWHAVAALVDPVRRALYDYVRRQRRAVTREEAADAHAISRGLTAFHLDKLVDVGLLRARYEAPVGRARGRGRTPKVYEPAGEDLLLTVPQRHYELVGEILADAIAAHPAADEGAQQEAFGRGRRLAGRRPPTTGSDGDDLAPVAAVLAQCGFEPRLAPAEPVAEPVGTGDGGQAPERVLLDNCPFHALAVRQPELICGLNRAFVAGVLDGLGADRLTARLAPRPGACCVEIGVSRQHG
jgi:predicted ArsR family transcriptional regulator